MPHYGTFQNVWALLDSDTFGPLDIERLQDFLDDAEVEFDNELRLRFAVPFTLADNPDAFDIAIKVTARMAAAKYIRARNQNSAQDLSWYARQMDKEAQEWIARLKTPLVPVDAPAAASPYVLRPTDGEGVARESAAFFKRTNVTPGSTSHY
jgi:phage gp36-like protein